MNNQNRGGNQNRFNNPFNVDPNNEDINITVKLNKDVFIPLNAISSNFGTESDYYSLRTVDPLNESFFHAIQSLIFPNLTFFQISSIFCYLITIMYIVTLFFGIDLTNKYEFLPIKLSTVDKIGSFYPTLIKNNILESYRLLIFQFLHYNLSHYLFCILSLITFCSLFEILIKKYVYFLILFFSGIFANLTGGLSFNENERSCGINSGIFGLMGAFCMLFIQNWDEMQILFGYMGRFLTIYLTCVFIFIGFCFIHFNEFANILVSIFSVMYGGLIYAILVKPIKVTRFKTMFRFFAVGFIVIVVPLSFIGIYRK